VDREGAMDVWVKMMGKMFFDEIRTKTVRGGN